MLPGSHYEVVCVQADGCEEMEVVGLSEVLARGGVRVTLAAVGGNPDHLVTLEAGTKIQTEKCLHHCSNFEFDVIVVPGGTIANTLGKCPLLRDMLHTQKSAGRLYGAIGRACVDVLYHHALVSGPIACHSMHKEAVGDLYSPNSVVVSDNCITSQGPATAIMMGLQLVALLRSKATATKLARELVVKGH